MGLDKVNNKTKDLCVHSSQSWVARGQNIPKISNARNLYFLASVFSRVNHSCFLQFFVMALGYLG